MKKSKERARKLRRGQTDAEKLMWRHLRNRQLNNAKFRRQHVIGSYIVDFVCWERKLIVEIDGGQHVDQVVYDQQRTDRFERAGYKVLRFWNNDVLTNIDSILNVILGALEVSPSPQPSPLCPPYGCKGRGSKSPVL